MNATKTCLALMLGAASACACADDALEASFFGIVDMTGAPRPELVHARPHPAITPDANGAQAPLYVHVRDGQEERWGSFCAAYRACGAPVFFVSERWYRNVYLPHVGGQSGREQHYRDLVRLARTEREHQRRCDDE